MEKQNYNKLKKRINELEKEIRKYERLEELLVEGKERLKAITHSSPDAIISTDKDGKIYMWNQGAKKLFGYKEREIIGKSVTKLMPERYIDTHNKGIKRANLTGEYHVIGKTVELHGLRKDGSEFPIELSLGVGKTNKILYTAIIRDITKRKKAEEALVKSEKKYRDLFEEAVDSICVLDTEGNFVDVNHATTTQTGYSKKELVKMNVKDIIYHKDRVKSAKYLNKLTEEGAYKLYEGRIVTKNGEIRYVEVDSNAIFENDKIIGSLDIVRDITEKKGLENKINKLQKEALSKLHEELRLARQIQMNLLPTTNPNIYGYDIAGKSIPAQSVGGDYYDFLRLDDSHIGVCLGDISGKGMPAALLMSNLQAIVRSQMQICNLPKNCVSNINSLLLKNTDINKYATLFLGILNFKKNEFRYTNAGHNPPIIFKSKMKYILLKKGGLIVGFIDKADYSDEIISFEIGDLCVIYSDGITEAMNKFNNEFGEKKLISLVKKNMRISSVEIIEKIIKAVKKHSKNVAQSDDITVVIIKRDK